MAQIYQKTQLRHGESEPRNLTSVQWRTVSRGRHVPMGRALAVVDIENLMGGPTNGVRWLSEAADEFRESAMLKRTDHVIVAANAGLAPWLRDVFPTARVQIGHGRDGADMALISAAGKPEFIAERYDRFIVGSGDAIFAEVAGAVATLGIRVEVVARAECLSLALRRCAAVIRYLPAFDLGWSA